MNVDGLTAGMAIEQSLTIGNYILGMFCVMVSALAGALVYIYKQQQRQQQESHDQMREMHKEMVDVVNGNKDALHELKTELQLTRQINEQTLDLVKRISGL